MAGGRPRRTRINTARSHSVALRRRVLAYASESFFGDQLVCFALGLRDPAEIDFITPTDYTRPEQVANVMHALERERVRYVLWYVGLDSPPADAQDHLAPLRAYLFSRYRMVKTFGDGDQVWERNL